ncbi:uncharacterized protein LOC142463897 [Ascaphus truei]|uniref:uncharacterized protein LOC142463897 n=1 Tax=Ascaphus truei TaxID=8439 RepID=UPI003F59C974
MTRDSQSQSVQLQRERERDRGIILLCKRNTIYISNCRGHHVVKHYHKDKTPFLVHLTNSLMMKKDKKQKIERILNLTLEIIYLLTGEDYIVVKKHGEHVRDSSSPFIPEGFCRIQRPIMEHPTNSLIHEGNNDHKLMSEKILEHTSKIIHLLAGEVPMRCDDVSVYFSMEEWEYLEGHKELYKDVMLGNQQTHSPLGIPANISSDLYNKHLDIVSMSEEGEGEKDEKDILQKEIHPDTCGGEVKAEIVSDVELIEEPCVSHLEAQVQEIHEHTSKTVGEGFSDLLGQHPCGNVRVQMCPWVRIYWKSLTQKSVHQM